MTANLFTRNLNFAFSYHNTVLTYIQLHCNIFGLKSILMLYLTSIILLSRYLYVFAKKLHKQRNGNKEKVKEAIYRVDGF